MKLLADMKIKTKLICGFSTIILLLLLTSYIGHNNTSHIYEDLDIIFSTELPRLDYLIEADRDLQQLLVAERSLIFVDPDSKTFAALLADYEKNMQQTKERMASFKNLSSLAVDLDLFNQFESALRQWEPASRTILNLRKAGNANVAALALGEVNDKFETMRGYLDQLTESVLGQARKSEQNAIGIYQSAGYVALTAILIAVILATLIVWLIISSINKPLAKTIQMLKALGDGRINQRANLTSKDEIGQMGKALDEFAESLQMEMVSPMQQLANGDLSFNVSPRDGEDKVRGALKQAGDELNLVMGQLQSSGDQISSASEQVASSSQSLSQSSTQIAASLEEISSSINEMASQTKQSSENANQASQLASDVQKAAENGGHQMQSMMTAMQEISESGQNISKIIKTIDEIAFQTNLLALNAAVEAARAGQHGKGFAVVAEEVRNLAARSAKAAQETALLIEGSVGKTQNGSEIAGKTSAALNEIVSGIAKVTEFVAEIAVASNEQAQGIAQINQGLGQIDQGVQQNTAIAEESASAAEELSSQAVYLKQMLSRFVLAEAQRQPALLKSNKVTTVATYSSQWPQNARQVSVAPGKNKVIHLDDTDFGRF